MVSAGPDGLSDKFRTLSQMLLKEEPLTDTLERVAEICRQTLPSCDLVGVTLMTDGRPRTAACTGHEALELDEAQYSSGDGPCLTAFEERTPQRIGDVATDDQWPAFAAEAKEHGVVGSLSLPLIADGRVTGALNLYSRRQGSFQDDERQLAELLSGQAAVAIANAEIFWRTYVLTQQLREAIESRDVIGQAKGILMALRRITADEAFDLLREASQASNVKLRVLAEEVVLTGQLPGEPPPSGVEG